MIYFGLLFVCFIGFFVIYLTMDKSHSAYLKVLSGVCGILIGSGAYFGFGSPLTSSIWLQTLYSTIFVVFICGISGVVINRQMLNLKNNELSFVHKQPIMIRVLVVVFVVLIVLYLKK